MTRSRFRKRIEELLQRADIAVGGGRPWDLQVHEDALFGRLLSQGSLGLGEAYMDGWWDCEYLDGFFHRLLTARLDAAVRTVGMAFSVVGARLSNRQSMARARRVARKHYDVGNDLYRNMLDSRMIYSCGYWAEAADLEAAQQAKLDLVCRKLLLEPGQRLLDIGCGWGGWRVSPPSATASRSSA